jgi:hypothetical protein
VIRHLVPPVDVDALVADAVGQGRVARLVLGEIALAHPRFLVTVIER